MRLLRLLWLIGQICMTGGEWSGLHRIRGIPPMRRYASVRTDASTRAPATRHHQDSAIALPFAVIIGRNLL